MTTRTRVHAIDRGFTPRRAFTMVELMTVLTIIVILVTIVIPVVSSVRKKAAAAAVGAQLAAISAAMDRYHQEFNSYPGPLPDDWLYPNVPPTNPPGLTIYNKASGAVLAAAPTNYITQTENAVLGLCGGLVVRATGPGYEFDAALIGNGPRNQNPAKPKRYEAFLETGAGKERWLTDRPDGSPTAAPYPGDYADGAGEGFDSAIPEFLDRFANPMPIIIMRARTGAGGVISINGLASDGTPVIPNPGPPPPALFPTQYDLNQALPYTLPNGGKSIGEGKTLKAKEYNPPLGGSEPSRHGLQTVNQNMTLNKTSQYPFDAFPYFVNGSIPPSDPMFPNRTGTPKQKDRYLIISAGIDRVYGTADDITQSGSISQ